MLPAEGCDPNIVGWNRLAFALQFESDFCVTMGGGLGDVQHCAVLEQPLKPAFVVRPVSRLRDSVAILTEYDNRNRHLVGASEQSNHSRIVVGCGGQRVGIENHYDLESAQTSGSIRSKASSTRLSI